MSRIALVPTEPPFNGYRVSVPDLRRPGRDADHSPVSSTEVKVYSTSVFHVLLYDVERENCIFFFISFNSWDETRDLLNTNSLR